MKRHLFTCLAAALTGAGLLCSGLSAGAANPYLPLWEYIPDGEPYVFEDPDNPGQYRVYIYGSHDIEITAYCGRNQVVWSAPVDDLLHWRYDGVIFESRLDADGQPLNPDGKGDILYAPDVVERIAPDGKKTYYLYPNTQAAGRNSMIARSERPDGPFTVCNWDPKDPKRTVGVLGFDPGAFIDDDGRVYGYWGFQQSFGAELDPETMCTVKKGTQPVRDMVSSLRQAGEFRFFDARGRDVDEDGKPIWTAAPGGNTHGSLCEIGGQWYVFYHRQTGLGGFDRQAMVAPVEVKVTEGPGGKVEITEGEYTSEGFELGGLNPLERHSAGIACWFTGPRPADKDNLGNKYYGSYIQPYRPGWDGEGDPYDISVNHNPVVNNTAGSVVGYKYFNFDGLKAARAKKLFVRLIPQGVKGRIVVMADHPRHGTRLGVIRLKGKTSDSPVQMKARVPKAARLQGKHALFFVFQSDTPDRSLCELEDFVFARR